MYYLSEILDHDQIMSLTSLCIDQMIEQEGVHCDLVSVPGNKKCFADTLQYFKGRAFIWYNDYTGSTKIADIEFKL